MKLQPYEDNMHIQSTHGKHTYNVEFVTTKNAISLAYRESNLQFHHVVVIGLLNHYHLMPNTK